MAELFRTHPLTRRHDPALAGNLWLRFINDFPEHDPTPLYGKAQVERKIARQALMAVRQPQTERTSVFLPRFERLYTGRFEKTEIVESTWGREILPFFKYFDAARRGENTDLHREAIYGSYLHLLGEMRAHYARLRTSGADDEALSDVRGRVTELIAGGLSARMRHPNILLVPSLVLQDRFGIPNDNHDYLYIDTFSEVPIVQPTQVKTNSRGYERSSGYFDDIALVFGDMDLHLCHYTPNRCKPSAAAQCLINKTAYYMLNEDTSQKTALLDTLTNNLLIKLSSWEDNKEHWLEALEEQQLANRAASNTSARLLCQA